MGMDDPSPREAHRALDIIGIEPPSQQPQSGLSPTQISGVPCEQLSRLPEVLAHEPHQIRENALLTAGGAVAVVQEQDHRPGAA
jgi:hypothetical protein